MIKYSIFFLIISFIITRIFAQTSSDQSIQITINTDTFIESPQIQLWDYMWKYHPGDNPEWASPEFDDTEWDLIDPELRPVEITRSGWQGVGWFRLHIKIDSSSSNFSLAIKGYHRGELDLFWDGQFITRNIDFRIPKEVSSEPGEHLLAVRFFNTSLAEIPKTGSPTGFFLYIGKYIEIIDNLLRQRSEQMFFVGLALAFSLLHLILFIFSPQSKGNLYYTIFLLFFAIGTFADIQSSHLAKDGQTALFYLRVHRAVLPISSLIFLRFVYSIFYKKCPNQFLVFTVLYIVVGILLAFEPGSNFHYFVKLDTIRTLEIFRMLFVAIRKKKDGAWIFAFGIIVLSIFGLYDALLDLDLLSPINQITNAYYFGAVGLFIATSVYLARDFARTNHRILKQEQQIRDEEFSRKLMEADNQRKTKELEDARKLQLSMLPNCVNDFPGFDICFHMDTATEVGGDYYDYHIEDDNTLTIAIGDATGHGMKAGTMVSVVKSLFIADAAQTDILPFLRKCSNTIKQMNLGNLYMALMLVKIKGNKLFASSAGMPPIYIYRHDNKLVEEMMIKGMPLGGGPDFPYKISETILNPGDTVLLMSDGFPELFNAKNEMLDYQRACDLFLETAEDSADDVVKYLTDAGKNWRKDRPQGDDITFIVIKTKNKN
ncbi:SpoIIE family protein phosphatase [Calditrichota bacterium]